MGTEYRIHSPNKGSYGGIRELEVETKFISGFQFQENVCELPWVTCLKRLCSSVTNAQIQNEIRCRLYVDIQLGFEVYNNAV